MYQTNREYREGTERVRGREGQFKQAAIGNISISSETLQRLRKMPRLRLNPKTAAVAAHKQPQNMALILWAHKPKNPVSIKLNGTVYVRERERESEQATYVCTRWLVCV